MSPELVDQTILALCKPQFQKVAFVIIGVATALKVPTPMERLMIDVPEEFEKPMDTNADFIADRIKALVKAEKLEAAGNIDHWRYSEIRLTGK